MGLISPYVQYIKFSTDIYEYISYAVDVMGDGLHFIE